MFQSLSAIATEKRYAFVQTFGVYLHSHHNELSFIWFSDEVHFWLNGYVNKQNCCIWSLQNPHDFETTPLHAQRVTVWAAFSARGVIGPVFLECNHGSYREMLNDEVIPVMKAMHNFRRFIFQMVQNLIRPTKRCYFSANISRQE
ncbi:hypothetical protein PGB90_000143 [Kerria lacca]